MSKKKSNPYWNTDWPQAQRQYMDAWTVFAQLMAHDIPVAGSNKKKNPMDGAMESWWKLVSPALPEGSYEFINKMMEQGKLFNILGEQFTRLLGNITEVNKATSNWQSVLNQQFEELKNMYSANQSEVNGAIHGMLGAWQLLPMDTLHRTFSSVSLLPGDFLEDIKPDVLEKVTDKFLSIPGVGYTRESQEQIQEGIRLWNLYQKTGNEYNNAMNKVGIDALEAMRLKIIAMAEQGKEINSLREIYDLWVDCNEEAYAAYVYTDEFSELYGRLTNALMAVKHHGRNYVDEALSAFNMPTRRSMNTIQKRQQEIRREQKETTKIVQGLQQDIISLRKHFSGITPANNKDSNGEIKPAKKTKLEKTTTKVRTKNKNVARTGSKNRSKGKSRKKSGTIVIKI